MLKHNIIGFWFEKKYNNFDNLTTVSIFAFGIKYGLLIGCLTGVIVGVIGRLAEKILFKRYKIKQTVIFSTKEI
jgi:thiamine transporter ThiT